MKLFFLSILFIFITFVSIGQTQGEMNEEAASDFKKADKELNATFQKILKEYIADTIFTMNLKKAQKTWIQFRDAEMDAKFPESPDHVYGSVAPMCWAMYKTDLTKERVKQLQVWLTGIEEGDVCAGSVKIK
jgi:uncharacterized protein YecT (DUF1311 family)